MRVVLRPPHALGPGLATGLLLPRHGEGVELIPPSRSEELAQLEGELAINARGTHGSLLPLPASLLLPLMDGVDEAGE